MDKKEFDIFIDKVIKYFGKKYFYLDPVGDVEQCVIDAVYDSIPKLDFNQPYNSLLSFIEGRVKYYLANMYNDYKKRNRIIERYTQEFIYKKKEPDYCLYILLDMIKELCKYDIISVLIGTETAKQCANRHGISIETVRYHVKKVKKFLKSQLI
jgi:hypothetical protein